MMLFTFSGEVQSPLERRGVNRRSPGFEVGNNGGDMELGILFLELINLHLEKQR
jgi:hypothetical protein